MIPGLILGVVFTTPQDIFGQNTGTITGTVSVSELRSAADVVVFIDKIPGTSFEPPKEHALMDQFRMEFVPHVLPILVGTSVDFPNRDPVRHNVFTPSEVGDKFNLGQYPGGTIKVVTFSKPGVVPLLCNTHAEMEAYILVLETRYYSLIKAEPGTRDGNYTISNVPPGTYVVKTWHRKAEESTQTVEVKAGGTVTVDFSIRRR